MRNVMSLADKMAWYLEDVFTKKKIPLELGVTTIGRTPLCGVQLDSAYCSRSHCNISIDTAGNINIEDFSSNGTFVNGRCYENQDTKIVEGDQIGIGCWPFDGIETTESLPVYKLCRENSNAAMMAHRTTATINIISDDEQEEVINISDEEGEDLNLQKYASKPNGSTAVASASGSASNSNGAQILPPAVPMAPMDVEPVPSTSGMLLTAARTTSLDEPEEMEVDIALSQSMILDIKQEVVDLNYEESFHVLPDGLTSPNGGFMTSTQNQYDEQKPFSTNLQEGNESPIFIIDDNDDDEEEIEEQKLSIWATKLSQSFNSSSRETPLKSSPHESASDEKAEEEVEQLSEIMDRSLSLEDMDALDDKFEPTKTTSPVTRAMTRSSPQQVKEKALEPKFSPKPGTSKQTDEVDHDCEERVTPQRNSAAGPSRRSDHGTSHLELKRKQPTVIDAPVLRTGRGKLRGHTLSVVSEVGKRAERLRLRDRIANQEKALQSKWHQKPTSERAELKQRKQTVQEERKQKLKELAEKQNQKRKLESDEQKIVKKPKVKITTKSRGALLAESLEQPENRAGPSRTNTDDLRTDEPSTSELSRKLLAESAKSDGSTKSSEGDSERPVVRRESRRDHRHPSKERHSSKTRRRDSSEHHKSDERSSRKRHRDSSDHHKDSSKTRQRDTSETHRNSTESKRHNKTESRSRERSKKETFEEALLSTNRRTRSSRRDENRDNPNEKRDKSTNGDKKNATNENEKSPALRRKTCDLKSILSSPKPRHRGKQKRSVTFSDKVDIRYFNIEEENTLTRRVNGKEAPLGRSAMHNLEAIQRRTQDNLIALDFTEKVMHDVLSWQPEWLESGNAYINGRDHFLMPMIQKYNCYEDFSRIIMPLFKIELWHSIQKDFEDRYKDDYMQFRVNNFVNDPRGRYVLHCEVNARAIKHKVLFVAQQLCLVKVDTGRDLFGIITSMGCSYYGKNEIMSIHLELMANSHYQHRLQKLTYVRIKPITNIRVEIGVYNAIANLQFSRLGSCILNPFQLVRKETPPKKPIRYVGYDKLNTTQQSILLNVYQRCVDTQNTNNLFLIEGPPGTGKSRIITNLALQCLYGDEARSLERVNQRKMKILICAQSNAAIDIIAQQLLNIRFLMGRDRFKMVRFGVMDRIHENVRCISLPKLVQSYIGAKVDKNSREILTQEANLLEKQIAALTATATPGNASGDELQKKKERLTKINQTLGIGLPMGKLDIHYGKFLNGANVVCTTLSSCINLLTHMKKFDLCIIDEATQCAEPYTLIPLQFGISSLVLVGDTQQLPATVLSKISEEYGFGRSLFTRIQECLKGMQNVPIQTLKTQYRMHPEICQWSNMYFYKNALVNDKSTEVDKSLIKPYAVLGLEYSQSTEEERGKLSNDQEAKFIVELISHLSKVMSPEYFSYGIITPYTHHKEILQKKINEAGIEKVMVNTVDSYQGKERDIIIFSCVRTKGVGFLSNCQRLNVALTRAKKCLFVCGNFTSLTQAPVWRSLLDNARSRELYYQIKPSDLEDFDAKVMCHLRNKI